MIISISLMVMFQFHQYTSRREHEVHLYISSVMVYENRSEILSDRCNRSDASLFSALNSMPTILAKNYPWLNGALFPLRSKSLLYCAIPKIASKSLISIIIYAYVRDILDNLTNHSPYDAVNKIQAERLIKISKLIEQLKKVKLVVPSIMQSNLVS